MKLVSFSLADGKIRPGSLLEEANLVVDLTAAGYPDALSVIAAGFTSVDASKTKAYPAYPLSEVRLHAPLPNPPRVFAIGLNYRDHAAESGMAIPTSPGRLLQADNRHHRPRRTHRPTRQLHPARLRSRDGLCHRPRRLSPSADEWRNHVYGYTIVNDVSARDVQFATSQWSMSKSFPTFCPIGPAIVTADEIADPHALAIGLSINGESSRTPTPAS
jgi:2-keto-4-pentenoate hydratase/2-oxohepta-3-ene-1,7-dioic acid hydratase in catechol pathway